LSPLGKTPKVGLPFGVFFMGLVLVAKDIIVFIFIIEYIVALRDFGPY
jgi:hypothetical protein